MDNIQSHILNTRYAMLSHIFRYRASTEDTSEVYMDGRYTDDTGVLTDIISLLDRKGKTLRTYALKSKHGIAYDLIKEEEDLTRNPTYNQ